VIWQLGVIDIGLMVILNITHHAHKTTAKKPSQNVFS
jgi:hypothetical protein